LLQQSKLVWIRLLVLYDCLVPTLHAIMLLYEALKQGKLILL